MGAKAASVTRELEAKGDGRSKADNGVLREPNMLTSLLGPSYFYFPIDLPLYFAVLFCPADMWRWL